ncbi:BQ5605_C023g09678 [Microbotryum silenes-dioicae]|uniref:BQ5605_C023g09678 protein n=1 Tax=Microbotryum silenes-dioicae TaxID=796604 RepID=A0A2X0PLN7_9BASI|nr:BQ5605_C023g09678 [Microbotryum silenes-dioicae]
MSIAAPADVAEGSTRSRSTSASPPPQLDPATLAILAGFLHEKDEADRQFQELSERVDKRKKAAQAAGEDGEDAHGPESADRGDEPDKALMMTVDEFRRLFGEDWQLSQFWYSQAFATTLAQYIRSLCPSTSTRVAFLCCPTAYVGFQHTNPLPRTLLLEYDKRFELLDADQFVHYDIDEPEYVPEGIKGTVDIAICDPPFLNEVTNRKLAKTLKQILKPDSKLLLLTSTSVEHLFDQIYTEAPLGPLIKTDIQVGHAGGIQNNFGVWRNWSN